MTNSAPIVGTAVIYDGVTYCLPKPARHHHVHQHIAKVNGLDVLGKDEQGFYDSNGKFLSREDALKVALEHDQVLNRNDIRANQLFSEDLW